MPKEAKRCELPFSIKKFQKNFVLHERLAVKNSFSKNVWSKVDICFCEAVYVLK